jgi:hypothetical protein
MKHLGESASSFKEVLHQAFVMGIRMAHLNITKSLEDFRVTLDRVAMAAGWDIISNVPWSVRTLQHAENAKRKLIMP